jgi:hypothetical protein
MEKFSISVSRDTEVLTFEVADYLHHEGDKCKFEVYQQGVFVAGFEPDAHQYLHVCKNPGNVEEEVLHLIADKIESYNL